MTNISFRIERQTSKTLRRISIVVHGLAVVAALSNSLPLAVKIILLILICVSYWRGVATLKPLSTTVLLYSRAQGWQVLQQNLILPIKILPTSLITPFLIIVYYKIHSEKSATASFVCFSDAVPAAIYRQFLVQLKLSSDVPHRRKL